MHENPEPNFYQKETMGTTIMAIKYDGGVIACADTRKPIDNLRNIIGRCLHSRQSS